MGFERGFGAQVTVRSVDTCGAGGVSGLLEARRMVLFEGWLSPPHPPHPLRLVLNVIFPSLPPEERMQPASLDKSVGWKSPC